MTATADRVLDDMPLVHQFIRVHGRRPTPEELRDHQRSGLLLYLQVRHGLRRRAARIITRT